MTTEERVFSAQVKDIAAVSAKMVPIVMEGRIVDKDGMRDGQDELVAHLLSDEATCARRLSQRLGAKSASIFV